MDFKTKFTLLERKQEANRVLLKFPDRIPIICERKMYEDLPEIDKIKYLVSNELTVGQFMFIIRNRMRLTDKKALFLFINKQLFTNSTYLSEIYINEKDEDGFLYIMYTAENTFG